MISINEMGSLIRQKEKSNYLEIACLPAHTSSCETWELTELTAIHSKTSHEWMKSNQIKSNMQIDLSSKSSFWNRNLSLSFLTNAGFGFLDDEWRISNFIAHFFLGVWRGVGWRESSRVFFYFVYFSHSLCLDITRSEHVELQRRAVYTSFSKKKLF